MTARTRATVDFHFTCPICEAIGSTQYQVRTGEEFPNPALPEGWQLDPCFGLTCGAHAIDVVISVDGKVWKEGV